jgi:hypothetical protein
MVELENHDYLKQPAASGQGRIRESRLSKTTCC